MSEGYVMNKMEGLLVEALRSGKYRQTSGCLRSSEDPCAYCIMGVALDVIDHKNWEDIQKEIAQEEHAWLWNGNQFSMDEPSMKHYGWFSRDNEFPMIHVPGGTRPHPVLYSTGIREQSQPYVSLSDLNDIHGMTFNQFADLIEQGYIVHEGDTEYHQYIYDRD